MANFTTSADLLDDILFRAGEPTDGTSDFDAAAIRALNRAYQGIWEGGQELDPEIHEFWWWIRKDDQGVLILNPIIDAETVNVTNNSANITFSTGPTPSVAGRHFKVDDHADVFIISTHTAGATAAVLESVYTGETDTSASYKVVQLDYDLANDILYLSTPLFAYQEDRQEIYGLSLLELRARWPLNQVSGGVPRNFAPITQTSIRFSHYGGASATKIIKVDYEYAREPIDLVDDTASPIVPRQYRKILADWALAFVLADKSDSRAGDAAAVARNGLLAMAKENRRRMMMTSEGYARIFPRQRDIRLLEGPLRTETGLIIGF